MASYPNVKSLQWSCQLRESLPLGKLKVQSSSHSAEAVCKSGNTFHINTLAQYCNWHFTFFMCPREHCKKVNQMLTTLAAEARVFNPTRGWGAMLVLDQLRQNYWLMLFGSQRPTSSGKRIPHLRFWAFHSSIHSKNSNTEYLLFAKISSRLRAQSGSKTSQSCRNRE